MGGNKAKALQLGTAVLWITIKILWITYVECGELAHLFENLKSDTPIYRELILAFPRYRFHVKSAKKSFFYPFLSTTLPHSHLELSPPNLEETKDNHSFRT